VKAMLARLPRVLLTLFIVVSLTFLVLNVLPSDPARLAAGPQARPSDVEAIRKELALDAKVAVRYRVFWKRLVHTSTADTKTHASCAHLGPLHLDLGKSYRERRSVIAMLAERLPRTAFLAVVGLGFQLLFGVLLGLLTTKYRGNWFEQWLLNISLAGVSVPTFVIGGLLRYVFAERLQLLPLDGFGKTPLEHLQCVILPGLTLGIYGAAYYAKLTREELGEEVRKDYIRTARAKGASENRALFVHALRNSLLPIVSTAAMDLGALLGGAVVTEGIFRWPGLGLLSVTALMERDGPVIIGAVLVTSVAIVVLNLASDGLIRWLDPRTRSRS
jgi:peptide/nickel transport system permease protein